MTERRRRSHADAIKGSGCQADPPCFLSEEDFLQFVEFLRKRTGRHFVNAHRYHLGEDIKRRLAALGLSDTASYLRLINSGWPGARDEIDALIDQTTSQCTAFFRHPGQIEAFGHIVGEILARRRQAARPELRIWSAACATGEEAYTLAMVLHDLGCTAENSDVSVKATDVCRKAVDQGRTGIYCADSLETVPEPYRSKYFQKIRGKPKKRVIAAELRAMVDFGVLNLSDERQVESIVGIDVIFCRNVLLYFDVSTRNMVVRWLWQCLRQSGYLVLGPCDGIRDLGEVFSKTARSQRIVQRIDGSSWLFPTQGG